MLFEKNSNISTLWILFIMAGILSLSIGFIVFNYHSFQQNQDLATDSNPDNINIPNILDWDHEGATLNNVEINNNRLRIQDTDETGFYTTKTFETNGFSEFQNLEIDTRQNEQNHIRVSLRLSDSEDMSENIQYQFSTTDGTIRYEDIDIQQKEYFDFRIRFDHETGSKSQVKSLNYNYVDVFLNQNNFVLNLLAIITTFVIIAWLLTVLIMVIE